MPQVLFSKQFGELSFSKTWAMGQTHLGLLTGGGYSHLSGHPVKSIDEGLEAIPPGPDRDAFMEWFQNKDKVPEEAIKRRIIVNPDGSYSFDDGSPIEKAEDLIGYFGSGDALEQALRWFAQELLRRSEVEKAKTSKAGAMGAAAKGDKKEKAPKGPAPKGTGKPATAPPEQPEQPEVALKD